MYTDADWAGDKGNRRSTSGYFSLVGGNLVTWRSKKQKLVSLSSAEAEFRGIAKGLAEAFWIRKLVSEIGFPPRGSTQIMCENKAAIQISENPVQHDWTKHVEITSTGEAASTQKESGRIVLDFDLNEVPAIMMEDEGGDANVNINGNGYASSSYNSNIGY
nr:putative copia-type protein [Tanacetum cinerariifolium]